MRMVGMRIGMVMMAFGMIVIMRVAMVVIMRMIMIVTVVVPVIVPRGRCMQMYAMDVAECGRPPNYWSTTALEW